MKKILKLRESKEIKVLFVIIAIVFIIYFVGKEKGKTQNDELKKLPQDDPKHPNNKLTDGEKDTVEKIAIGLHKDMNGLNIFSHDLTPYKNLNSCSDTLFVGVWNYFSLRYGNLEEWIKDESSLWAANTFNVLIDSIFERFRRLDLR